MEQNKRGMCFTQGGWGRPLRSCRGGKPAGNSPGGEVQAEGPPLGRGPGGVGSRVLPTAGSTLQGGEVEGGGNEEEWQLGPHWARQGWKAGKLVQVVAGGSVDPFHHQPARKAERARGAGRMGAGF